MKPAVFLDRDGVVNIDHGYVYLAKDIQWVRGIEDAIKYLNNNNYYVFVVTNQSGIARGYYNEDDVDNLHIWMTEYLENLGAHINKFYYASYHPTAINEKHLTNRNLRKPNPGMIFKAFEEWDIDINNSFLVGDKDTDIQAATNAGIDGYLFDGNDINSLIRSIVINKK